MTTGAWWNSPPNWPPPPPGWSPPPGWHPPADWPAPPPGWPFWLSPVPQAPMPNGGRKSQANIGVILGAAALAISPFMAWAHVFLLGSLNLFDLTSLNGNNAGWFPVTIILVGIAVAVLGMMRAQGGYVATLIVGLIAGLMGVLVFVGLVRGINEGDGFVTIGYGPFVGMLGLLVIVISSIFGLVAGRT